MLVYQRVLAPLKPRHSFWGATWRKLESYGMTVSEATETYDRKSRTWIPRKTNWLVVWNMTFMTFHILGMSSSQLTFIFFRGVGIPPISKQWTGKKDYVNRFPSIFPPHMHFFKATRDASCVFIRAPTLRNARLYQFVGYTVIYCTSCYIGDIPNFTLRCHQTWQLGNPRTFQLGSSSINCKSFPDDYPI